MRLAFFGGIYNNYLALESAIRDAQQWGAEQLFCLGDLGAFGPHPNRVFPLLHANDIHCIQGNYDHSIGNDLNDCQCGYTDSRDNHFAQISFDYTYENTSVENRLWMKTLPSELILEVNGVRILLCHGSPRQTNEFLWESTTSTHFLNRLADDSAADVILGTHTGLHWQRELSKQRLFANVGVLGRPENDGNTHVWYARMRTGEETEQGQGGKSPLQLDFVPVEYDHQRLADEMREEKLPEEFVETILTGWWTTCLEILPSKERKQGWY